jgi:peptidoglycan hydrolase-like protein with peptidoglycan-binding domain
VNPILQLQKDLNQLCHVGADGNKLDEDGIWGTNTKFAMQDFQSKNGLEITDELDETTKQMLDKIIRDIPLPTSNENVEETPVKKSDVPYVIDLCQQGIKMQVFTDHLEIKWIGQDSWKIINFNN